MFDVIGQPGLASLLDVAGFVLFGVGLTFYGMLRHFMTRSAPRLTFNDGIPFDIQIALSLRPTRRLQRWFFGGRHPLVDARMFYEVESADGRSWSPVRASAVWWDISTPTPAGRAVTVTRTRPVLLKLIIEEASSQCLMLGTVSRPIPIGTYLCRSEVYWADGERTGIERLFTVGTTDATWVNDEPIDL